MPAVKGVCMAKVVVAATEGTVGGHRGGAGHMWLCGQRDGW